MLEIIDIEAKKSTPHIFLDSINREFRIEGESYPENAVAFYKPIIDWVKDYLTVSDRGIDLSIKLLYINTSSTKALLVLLDLIEEAHEAGKQSHIRWIYNRENKVAYEIGEDLRQGLNLPFTIHQE